MGWGRMLLLGNWGQQMDIEDQKREIEDLRQRLQTDTGRADATQISRIFQLEKENNELRLYMAALIMYLGHQGILEQDEFRTLVDAIDAEDGSKDNGYRGEIIK